MSIAETRREQIFPVLDNAQIEAAKRFASGPPRDFAPGETRLDAMAMVAKRSSLPITPDNFPAN